ncbi:hypothetical protein [Anaerocolumna sp. MB42-C2]|nr:hypothetical protein [Anaerocolumna sp. MB42-C2]WMJ87036.1 hypothetical protein RBU59_23845 [Anaerocolumna sp. MB42-C2]
MDGKNGISAYRWIILLAILPIIISTELPVVLKMKESGFIKS